VRPEAAAIAPLLKNFAALWSQMTPGEQRSLLKVIFTGLYFDAEAHLQRALAAHNPFDRLLALPEDGRLDWGQMLNGQTSLWWQATHYF